MFVETANKPLSSEEPCGPDPDASVEYSNFAAAADARLPRTLREFNKSQLDAEQTLAQMQTYFKQFMDVRLLVLAAKYEILSNRIEGFADAVIAAALLVNERWDYFHPRGSEDEHMLRATVLSGLNDLPTVVLPLQTATLVTNRRLGPVNYRVVLLANKEAKPVPDEVPLELSSAHEALLKEDFEATKAAYELFAKIAEALKTIRTVFASKIGQENAPTIDRLEAAVTGICEFLGQIVEEREPKAPVAAAGTENPTQIESGSGIAPVTSSAQALVSAEEAAAALRAIEAYFSRFEPSNPALLLVRLARQLSGKSFVEALEILSPATAAKMVIKTTSEWPMTLSFEQLKALAALQSDQPAGASTEGVKPVEILSRQRAIGVMLDIEAYYRKNEPSSPIPVLLEKARRFSGADFRELLRDILNPAAG